MTDHSDVFVSYSRNDREAAINLRGQLQRCGLNVFKDDERIRAGELWLDRLQEAVGSCGAFVVLVGRDGVGRWIGAETQVALDRYFAPHDDAERLPIFPILLEGTEAETLPAIDEAIRVRDKLLLILSTNAIVSDWVEDEVNKAFAEERRRSQTVLFPIRIDEEVMKTDKPWAVKLRDQRNIGDFHQWKDHDAYQQAFFNRVLRDLKPGSFPYAPNAYPVGSASPTCCALGSWMHGARPDFPPIAYKMCLQLSQPDRHHAPYRCQWRLRSKTGACRSRSLW